MNDNFGNWIALLEQVGGNIAGVAYKYLPEEDFKAIKSTQEMQMAYWSETMQRLHACSASSILRLLKWMKATRLAYEDGNYYGFCSSLRCLLEACGDSFHTLGRVTYPICENFFLIETALRGDAVKVLLSTEVENELIHYVFGRKLSSNEKKSLDASHSAKQVREYIDAIGDAAVQELYAELCQVSHPSMYSLLPFMLFLEDGTLVLHKEDVDSELNSHIEQRYGESIHDAISLAAVTAICSLALINQFNAPVIETLKTEDVLPVIESSPLWAKIQQKVAASV